MTDDNVKMTITFPSGRKVETDSDSIEKLTKAMQNKKKRKEIIDKAIEDAHLEETQGKEDEFHRRRFRERKQ